MLTSKYLFGVNYGKAKFEMDLGIFALDRADICVPMENIVGHPIYLTEGKYKGPGDACVKELFIDLDEVPRSIKKLYVYVSTINTGEGAPLFNKAKHSFVRVSKSDSLNFNTEYIKFKLYNQFGTESAVMLYEFIWTGNDWKPKAEIRKNPEGLEGFKKFFKVT